MSAPEPITGPAPHPPAPDPPAATSAARAFWLWLTLILVITAAPYLQVVGQDFVNYDDNLFVVDNPAVNRGFTREGVQWAFGFEGRSQYHPLTWLSHQLDCELFGLNAPLHKVHNLLLHLACTALIFWLLVRATGLLGPAALVALLCGIHPLRVEAVAWVAERKELLSNLFGLLTMHAWLSYGRRPGVLRYLAVVGLFVLTLAAKPILVTLPAVLLLLDFWPLRRFPTDAWGPALRRLGWLMLEKLPLMPLSLLSAWLTIRVTAESGSFTAMEAWPLPMRLANALVGYLWYIQKTLVPTDMAVLHPLPPYFPLWTIATAIAVLTVLSALAIKYWRQAPYLLVGWLYFLGTLVPVIGLVQVGSQAYADRYSYITQVGLFLMLVYGGHALATRWGVRPASLRAGAAVACLGLTLVTAVQVSYWTNSITLFTRVLDVHPRTPAAHNNLGNEYMKLGRLDLARRHFQQAIVLGPASHAHVNLARLLLQERRFREARQQLLWAIEDKAHNGMAYMLIGDVLTEEGRLPDAVFAYRHALELEPLMAPAHVRCARTLMLMNQFEQALPHLGRSLELDPSNAWAHMLLVHALVRLNRHLDLAEASLRQAQILDGGHPDLPRLASELQSARAGRAPAPSAVPSPDRPRLMMPAQEP